MTVTIGLVGAGTRAGQVHAPTLATTPNVRFAGVWSRSPHSVRRLAATHDVRPYERFLDLVDDCDAVVFAVPPPAQAELAPDAARRGRAVFLERPLAGDIAGAEEVVAAVQRSRVVSQIGLAWRYDPRVLGFLSVVAKRIEPGSGSGRLICGHHRVGTAPAWRIERGVLRDEGADLLDLQEAALGPIVGVEAYGDPHGWIGIRLEHLVGRGSAATLSAVTEDVFRAEVEVFGPGGEAVLDCSHASGPESYRAMYDEFVAAVHEDVAPALDANHGLHLQRVIESAETDILRGA